MTLMTQFAALAPKNKDLAKESIVDYLNACNKVSAYSYGFTQSNLSPLIKPPAEYSDFVEKFGIAKGNAMKWNTSIIPNMIAIPQAIVGSNRIIQAKFKNIQADLDDDMTDSDVIADLKDNLERILTRAQGEHDSISSLINDIDTYSATLKADYDTLNNGLTMLLNTIDADKAEVQRLTTEISNLKEEVKKLNQYLTAAEVGLGVSVFVTAVGCVVGVATGGAGFAVSAIGVVGIGGSITGIVLANKQIHADQEKIATDASNLSDYNKDLLVLNAETLSLQALVEANDEARKALVDVGNLWKDLSDSTQALIDTIHQAESDTGNVAKAKTEINQVIADWNELEKFCESLTNIDYKFDPTVHNLS